MLSLIFITLLSILHITNAQVAPSILDTVAINFTSLATLTTTEGVDVSPLGDPGNYTLFAPSNEAIAAAVIPDATGAPSIENIVYSHVLTATVPAAAVVTFEEPVLLTITLSETPIRLNYYNADGLSGAICVNSAQVTTPDFGGVQSNGIIHEVDEVIIPAYRSFLDIVTAVGLNKLASVVGQINDDTVNAILSETNFTEQAYTVFAPTDAAFEEVETALNISDITEAGDELLLRVILGHVVPAAYYSKAFTDTSVTVDTASVEDPIDIVVDGGVQITSSGGVVATVTVADSTSYNGVAHVIDKVLLPPLSADTTEDATATDATATDATATEETTSSPATEATTSAPATESSAEDSSSSSSVLVYSFTAFSAVFLAFH